MGMGLTRLDQGLPWFFDEQVRALSGLVGFWPGEELSGTALVDASGNNRGGGYFGGPPNITFGQPGVGDGKPSVFFPGAGMAAFTGSLSGALTPNLCTLFQAVYLDPGAAADNNYHFSLFLQADSNNLFEMYKDNGTNGNSLRALFKFGGALSISGYHSYDRPRWMLAALAVNQAAGRARWYLDGIQQGPDITGLGTWAGNPTNLYIGTAAGNNWLGWIAKTGAVNAELSPQTIWSLSGRGRSASAAVHSMLYLGDSKTANYDTEWMEQFELQRATGQIWKQGAAKIAVGGITTAGMVDRCDADIAALPNKDLLTHIFINLGANDCVNQAWVDKATWKSKTLYLANAYHAGCPNARIYLTKIWRHDRSECLANIAQMNEATDELLASYPGYLRPFVNEANHLPGLDDGATCAPDKVHPNGPGYALLAPAKAKAILLEAWQ